MENNQTATLDDSDTSTNTNTESGTGTGTDTTNNIDGSTDNSTSASNDTGALPGDATTSDNTAASDAITGDDSQSASNNQETGDISLGAFGLISVIFSILISIVFLIGLWKIFEKLGEKGWKVLIPIYNIYIFIKIAFGNNNLSSAPKKDEFNFDDNIASINSFNNDNQDINNNQYQDNNFGTSMDQSNRLGGMDNSGMGLDTRLNSEDPNQNQGITEGPFETPFPGANPEINNEAPMNNMGTSDVQMGMPMGDMPNEGQGPINMPGPDMQQPGPNEFNNGPINMPGGPMPNMGPEGQNPEFNNGPINMPGGPGSKQCPNCHAPIPLNVVICPNCGTNLGGM